MLVFTISVVGAEEKGQKKNAIVITSTSLSADKENATFEGNVVAKTEDIALHADKMLVFYGDGGRITNIEANGNIKLVKGSRVVTAQKALFDAVAEKIILTGDPKAVEGENVITGTKITYSIKDNKTLIENSRVILKR